jgi:UDP-N-acetylglucosamine enolpyruvyl transferase
MGVISEVRNSVIRVQGVAKMHGAEHTIIATASKLEPS